MYATIQKIFNTLELPIEAIKNFTFYDKNLTEI